MSIISEEDLGKIKKIKGEVIGSALKCDEEFIIEKKRPGRIKKSRGRNGKIRLSFNVRGNR